MAETDSWEKLAKIRLGNRRKRRQMINDGISSLFYMLFFLSEVRLWLS
jgi:hypothetical protein